MVTKNYADALSEVIAKIFLADHAKTMASVFLACARFEFDDYGDINTDMISVFHN